MATTAKTIDSKIMNYLKVLNAGEKKTILSVVESFAKAHDDEWTLEEKKELDELNRLYKAGKIKTTTLAQIRKEAISRPKK